MMIGGCKTSSGVIPRLLDLDFFFGLVCTKFFVFLWTVFILFFNVI